MIETVYRFHIFVYHKNMSDVTTFFNSKFNHFLQKNYAEFRIWTYSSSLGIPLT